MLWKTIKIAGCNVLPQYCWAVVWDDLDTGELMYVESAGGPIGFTELQAQVVRDILNRQIEDTEASLGLNTYNAQPIKEIN